jgi:hypothetical protein
MEQKKKINQYILEKQIGRGGYGKVFIGYSELDKDLKTVTIKRVNF